MARPIDVEAALAELATARGIRMGAYPIPPDLGDRLPFVVVQRTGGATMSKVLDLHDVSFDCYAETWEEAMEASAAVCNIVNGSEGLQVGGTTCRSANVRTLPYNNPDPQRPDVPRVTLSATLAIRESR